MNNLALSLLGVADKATVMDTIMSSARRGARWLVAAYIAVAMLPALPAFAEDTAPAKIGQATGPDMEFKLDNPRIINPEAGRAVPFFTKAGGQRSCDYVFYTLSFGLRGTPQAFSSPGLSASLQRARLDFKDQLPHGLQIVNMQVSGDGTDASGGPLPGAVISNSAGPNDTATVSDFRISASDLDGSGALGERVITFRITARIDHAAFPAPATVDNQGLIKVTVGTGTGTIIPSQDPGKPDDSNFLTGEKTSIRIDLTKCNPPPPPPGKECFKVERGTVDCVPGGGAFIYHMPVGPEMGGKWVQLSTATPGITIVPDTQKVPAGGGVLNWKIVGASPGDVLHLVVTGIETYAGPKEGWGLCCTQTIDIVIPRDQRCPPKDREPDLKVEKRADVPRCTMAGGCDFTIRVTNVGDAPYNGKIVLDEVTLPAGSTLDSGPNPPWACVPGATPMICTHPVTTLNPGAFVDLELGFKPAGGWQGTSLRNCATYNYAASGKPLFGSQADDRGCASIPICRRGDRDRDCRPPVEKKADLILKKRARAEACTADGVCSFVIDIINNGTSTYNGPLTVIDTYPEGAPASSTFGPSPPWTCGPNGPGQFRCDNAGISLSPGASTAIVVKAVVPASYRSDTIENCAEVKPIPGEADLTNNRACAKQRIPRPNGGQPGLRITKTCSGSLAGAALVSCRITVSNAGTAAPTGPVRVNDAAALVSGGAPAQIQGATPDGAEWACGPVPADTLACQIPGAVMAPGTSRHFDVTVSANGEFENCARGSYGPAQGDDVIHSIGRACAKGGGPSSIRVEKTGDSKCRPGEPCSFEITITNDGPTGFSGPVRIGDAIGVEGLGRLEGVAITSIEPPFGCSPEPAALPASCIANLTLGAGESRVHNVTVVLPDDGRLANLQGSVSGQNCVGVLSPDTRVQGGGDVLSRDHAQGERGKAYACHPFTIRHETKKECSAGFVMNDAGRCACPQGTTYRNGQCSSGGVAIPPKEPKRCVLLEGQIRTEDGRCVCPRGTELENGACVKISRPGCTISGSVPTSDGDRCTCPRGTHLDRDANACVRDRPKPEQCTIRGQVHDADGECVCPRGTELRNGACRQVRPKPEQCTIRGQVHGADGECVCPRGTELRNGVCRRKRPDVEQCDIRGQIHNKRGECVCPRGTQVIDGACRRSRQESECAPGSQMVNGQCQPIFRRRCPEGMIGRYPNCRPVRGQPSLELNPGMLLQQVLPRRRPQSEQQQDTAPNRILNLQPQ
ncbi:DUF11 domain-containing protein [Mesorhizobium sp. BR1-1-9]|uniref:DUF7929 domain-containing protein n=1 Tax=unclassified Mesorhizobium TaxID=325217 RepID=UPI00112B8DAD|nr:MULTISPECIES: DUF11 domain-containing protein [unclassified Mesorhizobium]MBZ9806977.1 DUF11 domain-containing protein [Mesorhizobium sp. ESP-6-2]MBZ9871567.1 DUF11 domain-containing protein [Mesorhizobium sp. BR1-1-9]MBZ9940196.1 DUF11 domain-containing protein [Mesorhizobium sp. BR1-1-13]TPM30361.1 hypothetical protein FJ955_11275 [Mesorhizobium sp. B2-2-2]